MNEQLAELKAMEAIAAYECERAEGRPGGDEFNRASKLLDDLPPSRKEHWLEQLQFIKAHYGN